MLTYGIDVSDYQSPDAPAVTPGINFAMIKSTEGHTVVSPVQGEQATAARRAGHIVGFYHFLWPGNIPEQAAWFVDRCASVAGDILAVDWETTETGTAATCAEKDQFLGEVKRLRPTHRVVLYCNRDFWVNRDTTGRCGDGLWIADPSSPAGAPGIHHPWLFHQYATTGGIDRDCYSGTANSLRAWAWGASATGTPPAPVHTYTVRTGDTLSGIAAAHHLSLAQLEKLNPQIHDPNLIMPGQLVRLP